MALVSAREILLKAYKEGYAVAQINTNNLEWTKAILLTVQELKSPVIIGASEGAIKYMGGFRTVASLVKAMIEDLGITVPIILHLDHGSYEGCKKAMDAGFSSVMFDGSHFPIDENFQKSKEIVDLANSRGISVELEVGTIGGEEDGVIGAGENASVDECVKIGGLDLSMLAAGIGNIHGPYPDNWKGLNFPLLKEISDAVKKPMVLHGGTGIPEDQIKKAISLGISKINVNTELQLAFAAATRKYIEEKNDLNMSKKGFDPRKLLKYGYDGICQVIKDKLTMFGSVGKA
ncbi:fructose-bisphosphate aldolase class II [Mycoplasma haemofelis str. Langford 1]|uniref:Fructose-1,6-biphosphate aldolase, class II n=2 Tax=Mycoplasma haemofelis TaxID=29501 RepID=F6FFH2_MYCHI|nr:class II fructose-1,6-bisphosphate aldolase [Mycoplasma haemofelis]AEG72367.1 fructose-1,6-biphosphate aldolase, class II [Mycoplasma haemofelis Ohio2]CBY92053.1 fructose-bisphosphate aldolase class II [Mycoplasma haemofelis str. Langford 1]